MLCTVTSHKGRDTLGFSGRSLFEVRGAVNGFILENVFITPEF